LSLNFTARIARRSDYSKIVRLCNRAVGPDDYVLFGLADTIERGGLFLAFSGDQLVGMSNFTRTIDNAGWLGMARTDPDWRRKGVALFLQNEKGKYAKELGIRKFRLFVLSTNTASLRACLKGGFSKVAEAAHMSISPKKFKNNEIQFAHIDSKNSLRDLLRSKYALKMNGYIPYRWNFLKFMPGVLLEIQRRGELYESDGLKFILTEKLEHEGSHREFSLLEGSFERGVSSVISVGKKLGCDSLGAFIPFDHYLISIARKFGFRDDSWGWHCIVLEKKL
jgi:GNAT superfamily N-acetyltransferase